MKELLSRRRSSHRCPSFEDEVRQSLVKHAGQITESAEGTNEQGIRVLRVTAAGVVSEVSMQWVYYHITNAEGRRLALVFTVQTDLVEAFGQRDRAMVETLQFRERDATTEPKTPAAAPKAEAAKKPSKQPVSQR